MFSLIKKSLKKNNQIQVPLPIKLKSEYLVFVDGGALNNGKNNSLAGFSVYFDNHDIFNTTKMVNDNPTNNVAELSSILYAFNIINTNYKEFLNNKIVIVSDSMYAIKCTTTWADKWVDNNFKKINGKTISNKDLVSNIINQRNNIKKKGIDISFKHIKSHTPPPDLDNEIEYKIWYYNNLVDSKITELLHSK
jgi:ribonuclease HI